jgi:tetratricopeptide (TPR) repeat protein
LSQPNNIDKEIKELINKPLTPNNLNMLGDLYLRKGEKNKGIEYLYKAAAKSSLYPQKNRAISIYKKILHISPFEIDAHKKLIDIFSQEGVVSEEIKYLLSLAKLYQNKGDFQEINLIFRKIYELDPANKAAEYFFDRGKIDVESIVPPHDESEIEKEISPKEAIKEEKILSKPKIKSIVLIASVIVLFGMLSLSLYLLGNGTKAKKPVKINDERLWANNTKSIKDDNFEINVMLLTEELLHKLPITSRLSKKDLAENSFYLVKIKALKNCIPEGFVKSTQSYMHLIDKKGKLVNSKNFVEFDGIKKVISKTNVCGKDSGIIFTNFYIAYPKEPTIESLLIDGLERNKPLTIRWN